MAALATKALAAPAPGPTCVSCRWFVPSRAGGAARCYLNPPAPKMPWGEDSVRPVVSVNDTACSFHKPKG
jgi:hypothetical protein